MIFFTRDLYLGYQLKSGWERRALREWDRRREIYTRYAEVIAPMLPSTVVRLDREGLHDGVILETSRRSNELVLVVDTVNALSGFRGPAVRLTFQGVRGRPGVSRLEGEWWLYQEVHLSSRARFGLHVLFNKAELEIEADELSIEQSPRAGRGGGIATERRVVLDPGRGGTVR